VQLISLVSSTLCFFGAQLMFNNSLLMENEAMLGAQSCDLRVDGSEPRSEKLVATLAQELRFES